MLMNKRNSAQISRSTKGVIEVTWLPKNMTFGKEDFKLVRDQKKYYVDKTFLIKDIMDLGEGSSSLYTRPRRFGKSLSMSMLDAYFNRNYKGNTWFDGLKISDLRPDDPEKNSNIVLSMTLKGLGTGNYEDMIESIGDKVSDIYSWFPELAGSPKLDARKHQIYDDVLMSRASANALGNSLYNLCFMLHQHYGQKPIVLIDEYDHVMSRAYETPDRQKIVDFMELFLGTTLKTNDHLKLAVMTGVMQVPKESIFSGVNNLVVNDVFSDNVDDYGEAFGFTPDEVRKICEDMDAPERFDEAKLWYDGYRFGSAEMYNPWSIMGYAHEGFKADVYWINTSRNNILDDVLKRADEDTYRELEELLSGKHLLKLLDRNVTYGELYRSPSALYSILVMTGYLTAVRSGNRHEVFIPNTEIFKVFGKKVVDSISGGENYDLSGLTAAVKNGDAESTGRILTDLLEVLSVRMLRSEYAYQAYLAGLFVASREDHIVTTDRGRGDGYYDLMLTSTRRAGPDVLMEFKRCKRNESPEKIAEKALGQIIEKRYTAGTDKTVMAYGVAFKSKKATVTFRQIDLEH